MKKDFKKGYYLFWIILISLFFCPITTYAEKFSSDFINIDDHSFNHIGAEFTLSDVYFDKTSSNFGNRKSFGKLFGKMTNTSNYYITAYMTIDYYNSNYQIIARSTKTENPGSIKDNYLISIILYENDFLTSINFEEIAYFKISYYTEKGNLLPGKNTNTNSNSNSISNIKPSQTGKYSSLDYVIDKYDINIIVNENNSFDITENITAYFNTSKHGIIRSLPLKNNISRLDGSTSKNRAHISNLNVNNEYTATKENNYLKVKIGSPNNTVTGSQTYKITYNYNIGKDPLKDKDEFYFNIIGPEWDTYIGNITFNITMPKEFDKNNLGFSSGSIGSIGNNNIKYNVEKNKISGSYNGILSPNNALTMRLELPDGYFSNSKTIIDYRIYIMLLIPIISLILSIILWYKYGRDNMVVETVEFYPPEGFNSLEIGFMYKGKANDKDVTSLLIYLANKGYIKIQETEHKTLFSKIKSFQIIKLKEYDGNNLNERIFLRNLFKKSYSYDTQDKNNIVTEEDLTNKFYLTVRDILRNVNDKENKNKLFDKTTKLKSILVSLFIALSLVTIISIPTLEYGDYQSLIMTLILMLFYSPFYVVGLSANTPIFFRIIWLGFTIFHSFMFFSTLPITEALRSDTTYLFGFIIGICCIIGLIICLKFMPKRTPYGNEMLGKIKGFKNFLETAEKERLETLVLEKPTYFYDILPYTYVLGVSDKWIKKFESITTVPPSWYDSPSAFDMATFGTFMYSTMASANHAMTSSPSSGDGSSSSSGGSSGGGSSGGGSGGGGGSSW